MGVNGRSERSSTSSRLRTVLETILFRPDERTVVEECRRCGTTRETGGPCCPTCGCDEIARYHIG
ncbi:hypothetical protein C493_00110 [Natronolimnohabitans innermongolicus JCM 12255]|uniref:Small CPxCG-related zinc finger protein n=1 Tax=Natronolimnohabitans innermongolicus JCM 12255 TaxID=1227499 RepID=L9XKC2_9EURY|nr:hypothetical protein C493_00110 [Natronolimnohabitans innermongolicus JCM 12255]